MHRDSVRSGWKRFTPGTAASFKVRNIGNRLRPTALVAEAQKFFRVGITCELSAILIRANGERVDLGVLSRQKVTNNGVQFIANAFLNLTEAESMNYHGSGTDNTAEANADAALGAEVADARASGTQSSPANGQYRTVGTQTYGGARAIVEHGVFSSITIGAGTLLDRSVFAVINVDNLDQIQWTYTITFNAGG